MHLTLFVPGLLLPDEILADSVSGLTAPAVALLLGRGQRRNLTQDWLPGAFGLADLIPAAALRKVGAGGTAEGEWICLDPVNLQVSREGIHLADPRQIELDEEEVSALVAAVQPIFADWGRISPSAPSHWELQLQRALVLKPRPLPDCIGLPVDPDLPGGDDGQAWRRLIAEAQTVLHAHPVNRNRETLGKPTINSLWPWGQGALPKQIEANFNVVWSRDPVTAGLCVHAGLPCLATPDRFQPASGRVLAIVDSLAHPARTGDILAWREALLDFERAWLAPAITALKKAACRELRVIGTRVNGPPAVVAFSASRGDLRRFWRRPRPLTALTQMA